MRRLVAVSLASLLATACVVEEGPTAGDDLGKADDLSTAELAEEAKAFAEAFDFLSEEPSPTEIPRGAAATTGPEWVRRSFVLHHTWEERDLGVARLYAWTVAGRRVWAIRTSTDGDDSFVELFDGRGAWLATGTGGFEPDPEHEGEFDPIITWDETLGAVRDSFAQRDWSPEVEAFWAAVATAIEPTGPGGARIGADEIGPPLAALIAADLTASSIDDFEIPAIRRLLADRTIALTATARAFAAGTADFYAARFSSLGGVTQPSITASLALPAALAPRIGYARADRQGRAAGDLGRPAMVTVALGLGILPTAMLPSSPARFAAALRAVGATADQAERAISRLGGDDHGARIVAGRAYLQGEDGTQTALPGTTWFVLTPTKSFAALLYLHD